MLPRTLKKGRRNLRTERFKFYVGSKTDLRKSEWLLEGRMRDFGLRPLLCMIQTRFVLSIKAGRIFSVTDSCRLL